MPVPTPRPLNVQRVFATTSTVATGQVANVAVPFTGRLINVGATVASAVATADAACAVTLNGAAFSPAVSFTITSASSAAGTQGSAGATGMVNDGDLLTFTFSGSATGGGTGVSLWADIRRGN